MVVGGTSANTGHAQVPDVHNIMGGMESTAGVRLHNHRRKLRQRFDIIRKLGQGTYGKVQLGINKETGQEVAIKTIKKAKIETEADLVRIRREIQIMSSVRHPNIIHIYEVFENREKMVLVMEYAAGGELYDYLSARKVLEEEEARRIFRQVASSVYYCHKHQICHRDLKLENILLDETGNAKIADFGLSNVFDDQRMLTTFCGSPLYASPEIVRGTPYTGPEVDCWSLGVLLYTLVYGAMPFDGSNFKRLVKQISQGDYYEPKKPSPASTLIRHMLTVDPKCRASAEDICTHWWVNEGYGESCLEIAEHLAIQTPVRLDLLLSLIPPPPPPQSAAKESAAADETDSMNDYATAQSEPSKEEEEVGGAKEESHEKKKKRKEKKDKEKDSKRKKEENVVKIPPPEEVIPTVATPLSSSPIFLDAVSSETLQTLPVSPDMEVEEGVSTSSSWTMAQDTPLVPEGLPEPVLPVETPVSALAVISATVSSVLEPTFEETVDLPPASPVELKVANSESIATVEILPHTPWQTYEKPVEPISQNSGLPECNSGILVRESTVSKDVNRTSIGSVMSDSSIRDLDKDSDKELTSPPSGRLSLRDRLETSGSTTPSTPSPTRLSDKRHSRVFRQAELFESQQQTLPVSPPSRTMTLERPKKVTLYGLKVSDTRRMYEEQLANEKKPAVVVPSLKVSDAKRAFEISAATLKTRSASACNAMNKSTAAFPRRTVILTPESAPIQKTQPMARPKSESSIKNALSQSVPADATPSKREEKLPKTTSKVKEEVDTKKEEEEEQGEVVVGGLGVRIGAVGKVAGIAMETKAVPSGPPAGTSQEKVTPPPKKVSVKTMDLAPPMKRIASPDRVTLSQQVPVTVDTGIGPAHTVSMLVAGSTALNHTTSPPDTPRERFVASSPSKPPLATRVTSPTRVVMMQSPPVERVTSPLPWAKAMPPAPPRVKSPPPFPVSTPSTPSTKESKSQMLYPIQVTASTTGKKERIIPIQVEGRAPPTPPPPVNVAPTAEVIARRQESMTSVAESDSSRLSGWREPIRKSPREVIIPIAMEGGGFVTPKVQTPSTTTAEIKRPLRFDRSKRFGSLLSEEEDAGRNSPGLQRLSSFGKRQEIPREEGWNRTSRRLERSDSVSSGDDDDDDTFQLLTAESLFSNLLSRVRHLTRRANRDEPIMIRTRYTSPAPSNASEPRYSTTIHCTREGSDLGDASVSTSRSENSRGRGESGSDAGSSHRWSRGSPSSDLGSRTEAILRFPSREENVASWRRSSVPRESSLPPQDGGCVTDVNAAFTTSTLPRVRPASRVILSVHVPAHPTSISVAPASAHHPSSSALTLVQLTNPSPWPLPHPPECEQQPSSPGQHLWRSSVSFSVSSASSSTPSSTRAGDLDRYPLTAMLTRQALQSHLRQTGSDVSQSLPPSIGKEDTDNFSDASSSASGHRNNSLTRALARLNSVLKDSTLPGTREYNRTRSSRELGEDGLSSNNSNSSQPKDGRKYQRYGRAATTGEWIDAPSTSKSEGSGLSDEEMRLSYRTYTRTSSREYLSPDKDYGSLSNHSSRPTSPVNTSSLPRPVHHVPPPLQPVQEANEDSKAPTPQLERKGLPPAPVVIPVIPNALLTPKPHPKIANGSKASLAAEKPSISTPEMVVPVVVLRQTGQRNTRPFTAFYVPEVVNSSPGNPVRGPQATPIPVDQASNGRITNGNGMPVPESEDDKKNGGGKRVSRFLRPDFFDTPREESVYVRKTTPIDLEAAEKAKAKFLRSVEKRWEKYRWDDNKFPVTATPTAATPTLVHMSTQTPSVAPNVIPSLPKPVIPDSAAAPVASIIPPQAPRSKDIPSAPSQQVVVKPKQEGVESLELKESRDSKEPKKEEKPAKKSPERKSSPKLKVRRQFEHLLNLAAAQFQRSGSPSKPKVASKVEIKEKGKEKESNGEVVEPSLIKPSAVLKIQRNERQGNHSTNHTIPLEEDVEQGKFLEEVKKQSRPTVPMKPDHLKIQVNGTKSPSPIQVSGEDDSLVDLGLWREEVVPIAKLKGQDCGGTRNTGTPFGSRIPAERLSSPDMGDEVRSARIKRFDEPSTEITEGSEEIPGTPTECSWDSASVCSDLTRDREEDESVSDRIFRKSFYSRFNDAVNATPPSRHHKSSKNRRSATQDILDSPMLLLNRENTEESISLPPRNSNSKFSRQSSGLRSEESDAMFVRKFLSRSSSRHVNTLDSNSVEGNRRTSVTSPIDDGADLDRLGLRLINSRESSVSRHSSIRDPSAERSLSSSSSAKLRNSTANRDHSLSRYSDDKRTGTTTSNSSMVTTIDMSRNRSQTPLKSSYGVAESSSSTSSAGNIESREYRAYGSSRNPTSRFLGVDSDKSLTDSSSDSRSLNRRSMAPPVAEYSTCSLPRRLNRFSLHENQPAIRSLTRPSPEPSGSRYSALLEERNPWSPPSLRRPGLSSDPASTSSSSSSYSRRAPESTSFSLLSRDRDSSLSRRDATSSMFLRGTSSGLATDSYATLRNSAYLRPRR